ncbi:MAG TPA: hypothetical protein VNZ84_03035 [Methylophilus sp.]|nr:hypothetical protein [Methylophilus sp.]
MMLLCIFAVSVNAANSAPDDIQAKTADGDEVVLHSNGYWEFKDAKKAEVAKIKVEEFERSNGCPLGMRPSFLGMGRCIAYDDPILKRGSLSGKGR